MPHHKSCKKRVKTSEESRISNRTYRSQVRSIIRQVREAGTKSAAEENLSKAIALLDRLAQKGIMHKNTAANQKSRLTRFVNGLPS
jgi:small subunit ribosomal protein S20